MTEYYQSISTHEREDGIRKEECGKPVSTPENYIGMVSCPSCHKSWRVMKGKGKGSLSEDLKRWGFQPFQELRDETVQPGGQANHD
jgi:hypothetical protein